jgi:hypothetical protein
MIIRTSISEKVLSLRRLFISEPYDWYSRANTMESSLSYILRMFSTPSHCSRTQCEKISLMRVCMLKSSLSYFSLRKIFKATFSNYTCYLFVTELWFLRIRLCCDWPDSKACLIAPLSFNLEDAFDLLGRDFWKIELYLRHISCWIRPKWDI